MAARLVTPYIMLAEAPGYIGLGIQVATSPVRKEYVSILPEPLSTRGIPAGSRHDSPAAADHRYLQIDRCFTSRTDQLSRHGSISAVAVVVLHRPGEGLETWLHFQAYQNFRSLSVRQVDNCRRQTWPSNTAIRHPRWRTFPFQRSSQYRRRGHGRHAFYEVCSLES